MVSKRQEVFLKTLDTENLLNGYRGDSDEQTTLSQKALFDDALHILNNTSKKDARTWFLRTLKASYLHTLARYGEQLSRKEDKFFQTRQASQGSPFSDVEPERVMHTFNHYVRDLDVPAITNFQYEQQDFYDLVDTFTNLEVDHLEAKEREVTPNWESETILASNGDFLFVDLGVSGSRTEGDSMGHCGNGSGQSHQRVFSLRQKLPNGNVVPRATLIGNNCVFDEKGMVVSCDLGEIKGYANEKVSKKYRPYIAKAILELGVFKSKINGAYLPEVDLSLLDFERDTALKIASEIPTYANPFEASVLTDYKGGEILDNAISHHFSLEPDAMVTVGGNNIMSNLDRLIDPKLGGRAKLAEFMDFQESPNKHIFSTLPQDLQTDLMMFAITEGMDMSKLDVAGHIANGSALSVFYRGIVKTYLDEQSNPQVDALADGIAKELGCEVSVSKTGQTSISKSFSKTVIDFTKELASKSPDGNPMNNEETYKHLGKGTFNDGRLHVIERVQDQFIRDAKSSNVVSELILGVRIQPFANEQSLSMLKTTVTAMNKMLQHQIKEQGVVPNLQISNPGEIICGDDKVEIVSLPFTDIVAQSSKLGIDTESIRKTVINNMRWMGGDNPAIEELSFVMIREKGDGVTSKNIAVGAVIESDYEPKLLHVSMAHGAKELDSGVSDSILNLVASSSEISFSNHATTWRNEHQISIANMVVSPSAEMELLKTVGYEKGMTPPSFLFGTRSGVVSDLSKMSDAPNVLTEYSPESIVTLEPPAVHVIDAEDFYKQPAYARGSYNSKPIEHTNHGRMESNFRAIKSRILGSVASGNTVYLYQNLLNRHLEATGLSEHRLMGDRPDVNGQALGDYMSDVLSNYSYSDFAQTIAEIGSTHLESNCDRMGLNLVEHGEFEFKFQLKNDLSFFEKANVYKQYPAGNLDDQVCNLVHYHIVSNNKFLDCDDLNNIVVKHLQCELASDVLVNTNAHDEFAEKLFGSLDPESSPEKSEKIKSNFKAPSPF